MYERPLRKGVDFRLRRGFSLVVVDAPLGYGGRKRRAILYIDSANDSTFQHDRQMCIFA